MRHQGFEALATACFDKSPDHQGIHQLVRLVGAHYFAQARGIARRRNRPQADLAALHDAQHLLVVHQLLAGKARHGIEQVDIGAVLGHQTEGGAGGLEFAVLVVYQHDVLIDQRRFYPRDGRSTS